MLYSSSLIGASLLALHALASSEPIPQASTSSTTPSTASKSSIVPTSVYVESTVPTGTPIPGNYTGALRPQVHFSPPQEWMNDPCGLFRDANGTWHVYYQYNPTGLTASNQHWGHATSTDLYHWVNQPIALFPPNNYTFVFTGSAVVDVNNTSGFFPSQNNGVVAIFTLSESPGGRPGPQQQAIAYSHDGGFTFTMYEGNPVIPSTSSQFRDPHVTWYQDHWVMVVAYAQEFVVGIYTSPNLKEWTHTSNFSHYGLLGLQYECPNLVEMPVAGSDTTMYVMLISINPGAPLGGSISQYIPGYFNGTHFEPVDRAARIGDFGKDNYAGQFFNGIASGQDAVSIAWASNWQYAQQSPTGPMEGWRSCYTVPRRNYLTNITRVGWDMVSEPYDLQSVIGPILASNNSLGNGSISVDYSSVTSNAIYLAVNVTGINTTTVSPTATLNFTFWSPVSSESIIGGFFFGNENDFFVNRGGTRGFENPFFTNIFSTANPINANGTWSLEVVIDRSIFEVFLDGGERSATGVFYPLQPLTQLYVTAGDVLDSMKISVSVYALESAWAGLEDSAGTIVGNVTTSNAPAGSNSTTSSSTGWEYADMQEREVAR